CLIKNLYEIISLPHIKIYIKMALLQNNGGHTCKITGVRSTLLTRQLGFTMLLSDTIGAVGQNTRRVNQRKSEDGDFQRLLVSCLKSFGLNFGNSFFDIMLI
ncbi:hypothetical protein LR013_06150, partial [candidate division NPL-UPA2 bacterium]|nr:hypothetical protein [candidate division NPL-UPA2 bacterium]